jgi:redox-sensitive bicupin YhaK (pirin superfamily)
VAGAVWDETLAEGQQGWFLVHGGSVFIDGAEAREGHAAPIGGGARLRAGAEGARVFVFAGRPMAARPAQRGPFVGSDREMLDRFDGRFRSGGMGRLVAFDQAELDGLEGSDALPARPKIA